MARSANVGAANPLTPAPSPPEGGEGSEFASELGAASPRPRNGGEGQGEGGRRPRRTELATTRARDLRRTSTPPEHLLWSALRAKRTGPRFRRQEPIAGLTVDFVCHAARLVVEVDGAHHDLTWAADGARDAKLRAAGFRIVRFAATDVRDNLEGVVAAIRTAISAASPQ